MEIGTTVYISGAMRGRYCMNFENFFYWARVLRRSGYKVINPAEMDCLKMMDGWVFSDDKWREVLDDDLEIIRERADWMFVLSDSEESEGSIEEIAEMNKKGADLVFYEDKPMGGAE